MSRVILAIFCAFLIQGFCCLHWASDSIPDATTLKAHAGDTIQLPWNFSLNSNETLRYIRWFYLKDVSQQSQLVASFFNATFYPQPDFAQKVEYVASGMIALDHVTAGDTGNYSIVISYHTLDRTDYLENRWVFVNVESQSGNGTNPAMEEVEARLNKLEAQQTALQAENGVLKKENEELQQQMKTLTEEAKTNRVSFDAGLGLTNNYNGSEIITFPDVISNVGGSYDPSSGIFTSPKAGTYVFLVTIASSSTYNSGDVQLKADGGVIARAYAMRSSVNSLTSSCQGVVRLRKGQKVWVECFEMTATCTFWSSATTFSGFLLHA